jgi:hypothetical protein
MDPGGDKIGTERPVICGGIQERMRSRVWRTDDKIKTASLT